MRFLPPGTQGASTAVGDREVNDYGVKNAPDGKAQGLREHRQGKQPAQRGLRSTGGGRGGSTRWGGLRRGWENGQRERHLIREGCRG